MYRRAKQESRPKPFIMAKATIAMACSLAALTVFGTGATAQPNGPPAASKHDFVDCRLPGIVTRLGRYNTRMQRGKLVRTTARTCEIRGGQYVLEDRGSFEGSLEVWLAEASLGDPKAQTYVGELYERGPNGQPDYELARIWYQRAAKQDYPPAQFSLARFYDEGLGGPVNKDEASRLYYAAMGAEESLKRVLNLVDADQVAELNLTIEQRDATIASQRQTIDRLNEEKTALRLERDYAQQRIASLEQSLSSARAQLASSMSLQAHTVRDLESKIAALNAERRALSNRESQLRQSEQELARQQAELAASLNTAPAPAISQAEYARVKSDLAAAEATISGLISQRDQALQAEEKALKSLSEADAKLASDLENISSREASLARREAELALNTDTSNSARQSLANERETLKRERDELVSKTRTFAAEFDALETAKRDIAQANAELARQRKQIEYRSKILQTMESVAAAVRDQQTELQTKLADVEHKAAELASFRNNYERKLADLLLREDELTRREQDVLLKASSLTRDENQMEEMKARLLHAEARAARAEQGLSDARAKLDEILNTASRGSTASTNNSLSDRDEILKKVDFGNYHAILIGNENYHNEGWNDLVTPHEDVDVIGNILRSRYGFKVTILKDATEDEMQDAIAEMSSKMKSRDNLLIYFAGHGQLFHGLGRGYWEPVDSVPNESYRSIHSGWITETMQRSNARKVLVIADSCYSGILTRAPRSILQADVQDDLLEAFVIRQAESKSRTVFTSGGLQPVADGGGGNHSLFANELIRALNEVAAPIRAGDLATEVSIRVQKSAIQLSHEQKPLYEAISGDAHAGGDFIFVPKL